MPSKLILWITIGAAVQAMASGAPTNNDVICTTQQCVLAAADIIRDMNPDVDPCVNFNQYASAYVSCMNVDKISSVGRKPLQEDTLKPVEMFPVSDSALATKSTVVPTSPNTDKRTLATTLAYFVSHDFDTPLSLSPATDVKNPDKTILAISENGLGLDFKGNYAEAWITSVYQTTIASMFSLGDGPQNSTSATVLASWTDVAKDVYAFEKVACRDRFEPGGDDGPTPDIKSHEFDWPWLLEKALLPGMQVPEPLTVSSKDYLSRLEALLQKTSPKTMQNYLAWTMIRKNQDSLDNDAARRADKDGDHGRQGRVVGLEPGYGSSVLLDQYYKGLELKDDDVYGNSADEFVSDTEGPPAFHVDNPDYANYGAIGVIAGHEITHGFDNQSHLFDSKGRMENYGNFTIKDPVGKETHLNGQMTLGENLTDNGGLKKAFETWQARYKSDPSGKTIKNQRLPGLEALTPEQLFFVSYARMWCSKMRPESLLQQVLTNPHSPPDGGSKARCRTRTFVG
ncbi:hypothetical protein CPC16_008637 [Podila verticillata]|nr:hypothetical protein CPC16_008637 [Podila verticillata]